MLWCLPWSADCGDSEDPKVESSKEKKARQQCRRKNFRPHKIRRLSATATTPITAKEHNSSSHHGQTKHTRALHLERYKTTTEPGSTYVGRGIKWQKPHYRLELVCKTFWGMVKALDEKVILLQCKNREAMMSEAERAEFHADEPSPSKVGWVSRLDAALNISHHIAT